MSNTVFINLSIKDVQRSTDFFTALGYEFDPRFGDENVACLVLTENTYALLLHEPTFKEATGGRVPTDPRTAPEALIALSVESRARVDELTEKAVAAGGTEVGEAQDMGFMYGRSYADLDGHTWNLFFMEADAPA